MQFLQVFRSRVNPVLTSACSIRFRAWTQETVSLGAWTALVTIALW